MERTPLQNRSLHLYFRQLADELNNSGLDQRKVLKPSIAIPWDDKSIKEQLWRPIQKAQVHKESSKDLDSKEIDKIYDTLNRHLGEKFGVYVEFPSEESLYYKNN